MDYGFTIRILLDTGRIPMGTTIHTGQARMVIASYRVQIAEQPMHDTDLPPPRLVERVGFQVMITTTGTLKMSCVSAVSR